MSTLALQDPTDGCLEVTANNNTTTEADLMMGTTSVALEFEVPSAVACLLALSQRSEGGAGAEPEKEEEDDACKITARHARTDRSQIDSSIARPSAGESLTASSN